MRRCVLTAALALFAAFAGCKPAEETVPVPKPLVVETPWSYALARTIDAGDGELHGVDVAPDGSIVLSTSTGLRFHGPDGEFVRSVPTAVAAHCVAWGPEGRIFIGLADRVEVRDAQGAAAGTWQTWEFDGAQMAFEDITDIATAGGIVYVADGLAMRIYRFDANGEYIGEMGGEKDSRLILPSSHLDVVPMPDGNLLVNNPGRALVEVRRADGLRVSAWGERGQSARGFSGCCNPTDIALMPGGEVVTAEKGLPRVKVYAPGGAELLAYIGIDSFSREPKGLDVAVGAGRRIYVADPGDDRVRVFEREGGDDDTTAE